MGQQLAIIYSIASGISSSNIQIQGSNLQLQDGSMILMQNQGVESDGILRVNVTDSIILIDTKPELTTVVGGLRTQTVAEGSGGDIVVSTQQLGIFNGAGIRTSSFPSNNGFDGPSGNVNILAKQLTLTDGGAISSAVFGDKDAGNININVDESIVIKGVNPNTGLVSFITTSTVQGAGNAGEAIINTNKLSLIDGGAITTSSFNSIGNAGNLTINVTESIEISGQDFLSSDPSSITSNATNFNPALAESFNIQTLNTGDAGTITVNTPQLTLAQGGEISVSNDGTGNPGSLQINADVINLDNSQISATSQEGREGNISIRASDLLELRNGSQITTQAGTETTGGGDGGDISLNADNIVVLEGSQINANAFEGSGGNINITTQGLFTSPDSKITASSAFGISGIVTINNPEVDPSSAIAPLSQETTDLSQLIAAGCVDSGNSSFTFIARGGLPLSPLDPLRSQTLWQDLENYAVSKQPAFSANQIVTHQTLPKYQHQLIESTGWIRHSDGRVELVVLMPNQNWYKSINCQDL